MTAELFLYLGALMHEFECSELTLRSEFGLDDGDGRSNLRLDHQIDARPFLRKRCWRD
jgi:hypothetical protein